MLCNFFVSLRADRLTNMIRNLMLISFIFVLVTACKSHRHETGCILPDSVKLQVGDVVFRRGGGLESHAVLLMDSEGEYSHVGIVVDTMGRKMIVHAVPGEPDFEGDMDRVKLDSVEKFFSPLYAVTGAVARPMDNRCGQKAAKKAMELFRRGVLFDDDYDMSDTTKFYCTELVLWAFERSGIKLLCTPPNHVELPMLKADVYYPSDVYHSKYLHTISIF